MVTTRCQTLRRIVTCSCSIPASIGRSLASNISPSVTTFTTNRRRAENRRIRVATVSVLTTLLIMTFAMRLLVTDVHPLEFRGRTWPPEVPDDNNTYHSTSSPVKFRNSWSRYVIDISQTSSDNRVDYEMNSTWQRLISKDRSLNLADAATVTEEPGFQNVGRYQSDNMPFRNSSSLNGSLTLNSRHIDPKSSDSVLLEVIRRAESVRRFCRHRINNTERDPRMDSTRPTFNASDLFRREPIVTSPSPSFSIFLQRLLIDSRHSIVYCDVPKVASSTVKAALAVATGRLSASIGGDPSESQLRRLRVHNPKFMASIGLRSLANPRWQKIVRKFAGRHAIGGGNIWSPSLVTEKTDIDKIVDYFSHRNYRKFVVVRHPFDRLVSAYRDKFVRRNRWTDYFHRKYGRLIVSRYRDNQSSIRWRYATTTNNGLATPSPSAGDENDNQGHDVTFVEFVRFLIDGAPEVKTLKDNPHWQPIAELCRPCIVDYNYVIRIESFKPEMTAVWSELLQLPTSAITAASRSVLEQRRNRGPDAEPVDDVRPSEVKDNGSNHEVNSMTITSRYTKLLSRDQLCRLAAFYHEDFELFGYESNVNCSNFTETFESSLKM